MLVLALEGGHRGANSRNTFLFLSRIVFKDLFTSPQGGLQTAVSRHDWSWDYHQKTNVVSRRILSGDSRLATKSVFR